MTRDQSFPDLLNISIHGKWQGQNWAEPHMALFTSLQPSKDAVFHIQKELRQMCVLNGCGMSFHLSGPDRCSKVREDCGTSCFYVTHLQKDRLELDFLKKKKKKGKFLNVHLFKNHICAI